MLVVKDITKRFGGITALEKVNLELNRGEVTAVIGENGAGKSTLMKILSGVYQDYEGEIILHGQQVKFANPRQAQDHGIAIIHQELNLIPQLTVVQNIFLGRELVTPYGMLDKRAMRKQVQSLLMRLKLEVAPDTPVNQLKVGQQQVLEIAKALLLDSRVIIMDEPTSAISESEVEVLFEIIQSLRAEGKAIVYISHKLEELTRIADRYIVLRDGSTVDTGSMQGIRQDDIIHKMAGREIKINKKARGTPSTGDLLSVNGLSLKHPHLPGAYLLNNISLELGKGEVLGIFGLMGAGRTELLEALFGLHAKHMSGTVLLEGKTLNLKSPGQAIKAGLALVPEDRKTDGLVLGMDVKENISLPVLQKVTSMGFLSNQKEKSLAQSYISDLRIKASSEAQVVQNLSGGNQQKVVLAKWLASHPKVLMLDEPTRGIDVNAKSEIYKLIGQLAGAGIGLIIVSSEIPEILTVSDRIMVMTEGRITGQLSIEEATEDKILSASIPKTV